MSLRGLVLGVDPGKTTGIAVFEGNGTFKFANQLSIQEMENLAASFNEPIAVIVVEDYLTFRQRAVQQTGSRQHASQVIGMMKVLAKRTGARFVLQPAARKEEGAKLSGKKPPSNHAFSHQVDAYNHAFFWLYQAGLVKSVLEKEKLK